jgi:deazaflavin-dependent oxidoreductase (nitroreductase family)
LGAAPSPAWYSNLMAAGKAEIVIDGVTRAVTASLASGDERDRLWSAMRDVYRGYDVYQRRTDRKFAVIILTPIAAATSDGSGRE